MCIRDSVGLVGMPNAGKSSILNFVTNAKSKVADYAFTTLHPHIGMVQKEDLEFVLADIPGLIEHASVKVLAMIFYPMWKDVKF